MDFIPSKLLVIVFLYCCVNAFGTGEANPGLPDSNGSQNSEITESEPSIEVNVEQTDGNTNEQSVQTETPHQKSSKAQSLVQLISKSILKFKGKDSQKKSKRSIINEKDSQSIDRIHEGVKGVSPHQLKHHDDPNFNATIDTSTHQLNDFKSSSDPKIEQQDFKEKIKEVKPPKKTTEHKPYSKTDRKSDKNNKHSKKKYISDRQKRSFVYFN